MSGEIVVPSPIATGGGGERFEQRVDAYALALLLVRSTAPVLLDSEVVAVHLQTRHLGWLTDDLLIVGEAGAGLTRKLAIQVKRRFTVSAADADCVATIEAMWSDFVASDRFDPQRDRLAVATLHGTSTLLSSFTSLLDTARSVASADEFRRRLQLRGFLSEKTRSQNEALRAIVANHVSGPIDEDLYWRFLSVITVLSLDLGTDSAHTEAQIVALLAHTVSEAGDPKTAARVTWRHLLDIASEGRQTAGSYDRASLPLELRKRHGVISAADGRATRDLIAHGHVVRDAIRTTIGAGYALDRSTHAAALRAHVDQSRSVVLTGAAGAGKSALAKSFLAIVELERPVFAFQAVEFANAHINDTLHRTQTALSAEALLSILGAHDRVTIFIDGVERLLESSVRDAFTHLLRLAAKTPSVQLLLTCRDYSLETVRTELLAPAGLMYGVLEVGTLDDDEVDWLAENVPSLGPPLGDARIRSFLRTPYLLDMAARIDWTRENMPRDQRAFRDLCWRQLVRADAYTSRGMPQRREVAFMDVARRRAAELRPYVTPGVADPEALDELVRDSLLERKHGSVRLYSPAHDVLEDWAIVRWLDEEAAVAQDAPAALSRATGGLPAVRRGFRRWLAEMFDSDAPAAADLVRVASRRVDLPQHFRDDCIVTVLSSHAASHFTASVRDQVGRGDVSLLRQHVHLLRVACKTAPAWLPSTGLPSTLLVPTGPGWTPTLELVADVAQSLEGGDALLALGLVEDWVRQLTIWTPSPAGADAAGRIASALLQKFGGYGSDDAFKRVLEVILKVPSHAPAFRDLVERAVANEPGDHSSREFAELVTSTTATAFASRDFPDDVIRIVRARAVMTEADLRQRYFGSRLGVDQFFGIREHGLSDYFPASALQGPFWALLRHHPIRGVAFILELLNHAAAWYVEKPGNDLEPVDQVKVQVPGVGEVAQWVNGRFFCMYRGMSVGPHVLESTLMALEGWLLEKAERDDFDLDSWLVYILRQSNNAMATGVVSSLSTAFPERAGRAAVAVLSCREFIQLDLQRRAQESITSLEFMTGLNPSHRIYEEERKNANARPHRREDLESLAIRLQLTDRRDEVWQIIDRHRSELPEPGDQETLTWRLALHRMDVRGYTPIVPEPENVDQSDDGRVYFGPGGLEPEVERLVESSREQMEEVNRYLRLINEARSAWETRRPDAPEQEWRGLLAEARVMDAEGDAPAPYVEGAPGLVAAVCIRDHLVDLTADELAWCVARLTAETAVPEDDVDPHSRMFGPDRAAAAVVPLLIARLPHAVGRDAEEWLIDVLTHPVHEVADYAYAGAAAFLGPEHTDLILKCCAVAVLHADIAEQERRANTKPQHVGDTLSRRHASVGHEVIRRLLHRSAHEAAARIKTVRFDSWEHRRAARHVATVLEHRHERDEARAFYLDAAQWLANKWKDRRHSRGDRDFHFEFDLSKRIAKFALCLPEAEARRVCAPLEELVDSEPNEVERFIHDLIAVADGGGDDSFWAIWQGFADRFVSAPWVPRLDVGRAYEATFIHRMFLSTYWKAYIKHWARLDGQAWRVDALAERLPCAPITVEAYARFLNTIGQRSLPDAFKTIHAILLRGDGQHAVSGSETSYLLESLLGRFVRSQPHRLKADSLLKDAVLHLLDVLVSAGSSAAYRMRDDFVTPVRMPGVG